jgi:hypothetical protein
MVGRRKYSPFRKISVMRFSSDIWEVSYIQGSRNADFHDRETFILIRKTRKSSSWRELRQIYGFQGLARESSFCNWSFTELR